MPARRNRLQIEQDLSHQKGAWRFQRVGWIVMLLFVVAGLSGLLGSGPLSNATVGRPNDLFWIDYNRFGRMHSPMELRLRFSSPVKQDGELRVWINRAYMEAIQVQRITPEPARVELEQDRFVHVFSIGTLTEPGSITIHFEPTRAGRQSAEIGYDEHPALSFTQLIYP